MVLVWDGCVSACIMLSLALTGGIQGLLESVLVHAVGATLLPLCCDAVEPTPFLDASM